MGRKTKEIDFIVIGAAKAGTTALFGFIEGRPDIYIPTGKEIPFFSENAVYHKGFDWYKNSILGGAPESAVCGTVTPQYMMGSTDVDVPTIVKRMKQDCPKVKLVAVLRDPIDRTYSHYKMMRRQGYEKRDFREAMKDSMSRLSSLNHPKKVDQPLAGSQYGRILEEYYQEFDKEQILVIFAEELRKNPQHQVDRFCKFVGAKKFKVDSGRQKTANQGGEKPKFKLLTPAFLNRLPIAYFWRKVVPYTVQKKVNFWINTWNIKPDNIAMDKNSEVYSELLEYFEGDVESLKKLTGDKIPWSEFNV